MFFFFKKTKIGLFWLISDQRRTRTLLFFIFVGYFTTNGKNWTRTAFVCCAQKKEQAVKARTKKCFFH